MLTPCSIYQSTIPLTSALTGLELKQQEILGWKHFLGFLNLLLEDSQKSLLAFQGSLRAGTKGAKHKWGRSQKTRCIVLTTGIKTSHKENRERAREVSQKSATVLWQEDHTTQLWCSRKTTQHNTIVLWQEDHTIQVWCSRNTTPHNTTVVQQEDIQNNTSVVQQQTTPHKTTVVQQERTTRLWCSGKTTHCYGSQCRTDALVSPW